MELWSRMWCGYSPTRSESGSAVVDLGFSWTEFGALLVWNLIWCLCLPTSLIHYLAFDCLVAGDLLLLEHCISIVTTKLY